MTRQLIAGIVDFALGKIQNSSCPGLELGKWEGGSVPITAGAAPTPVSTEAHGKNPISVNIVGMKRSSGARSCRELSHVVCWSSTCKWWQDQLLTLVLLGWSLLSISTNSWSYGTTARHSLGAVQGPVLVPFQPFYYLVVSYFISLPCPWFNGAVGCFLILLWC